MNTKKILIGVAIAGIITVGVWALMKYGNVNDRKAEMAQFLVAKGFHHDLSFLLSAGDDYITAWYKAAKAGNTTFKVGEKYYSTMGGKAVVYTSQNW